MDVLAEHQIAGRMVDFPVIVVPEVTTLSVDFRDELLAYARGGGSLVLVGARTAGLFAAELGVKLAGEPHKREDFFIEPVSGNPAVIGMCEGEWQAVEAQSAVVIGWRYPTHDPRKNALPAATFQPLGQGRLAAIYGPLGSVHFACHTPVVRHFLHKVMRKVFPQPMVEVSSSAWIDVSVRRKGDRLLVHLANTAGMQIDSRYTVVDTIPEIGPLTVKIRLDQAPRSVGQIPEGSTVVYAWQDGILTVRIDRLHIHMVLVVDL